jgi:protein O-mannosyl-transferase
MLTRQPSNPSRFALAATAIALMTAAVYSAVGSFDFTNFDDPDYVARNETVQRGLTFHGLRWAFTTNFMGNWHPLTWLSHMLDCQFFGVNPGAHHWVSVFIHVCNSVLLLWVLYRYTNALGRSFMVAALFAVHPLHVESVAWIAERKDVLSAFFWILTMWAYLRYVETRSDRHYGLVLLFFALGLMSKPMLVTLPFVLLLLDYWPLRRVAIMWDWLRLVREKLPLFVLTLLSSGLTFIVQKQGGAVGSLEKFAPGARIANALVAYVAYLGKTILPENLAAFYPHPDSWPAWQVAGAVALLSGLSFLALGLRRRATYLAMGWLWYVGTLVPVIGLVQVGDQAYADRYTYIPLIGLFMAVVWSAADLAVRLHWPALAVRATAVALLLLFAMVTARQVTHWQNAETVFRHALAVTKDNYVAHYNLGQTLSVQGRIQDAIEHYYATLRLKPDHEGAHNNLGLTFAFHGQWQEATNHYLAALRANPGNPDVHFNMGIAQMNLGDMTDAIRHLTITVERLPSHPLAHRYLGDALADARRVKEAMAEYRKALQVNPNQPEALNNLAWLLATQPDDTVRNGKEAVHLAEQACQLTQFGSPLMLGTLAAAYAEAGQFEHAVQTARRAEGVATQQGNTELASKLHAMAEKYERHQAHRD